MATEEALATATATRNGIASHRRDTTVAVARPEKVARDAGNLLTRTPRHIDYLATPESRSRVRTRRISLPLSLSRSRKTHSHSLTHIHPKAQNTNTEPRACANAPRSLPRPVSSRQFFTSLCNLYAPHRVYRLHAPYANSSLIHCCTCTVEACNPLPRLPAPES